MRRRGNVGEEGSIQGGSRKGSGEEERKGDQGGCEQKKKDKYIGIASQLLLVSF